MHWSGQLYHRMKAGESSGCLKLGYISQPSSPAHALHWRYKVSVLLSVNAISVLSLCGYMETILHIIWTEYFRGIDHTMEVVRHGWLRVTLPLNEVLLFMDARSANTLLLNVLVLHHRSGLRSWGALF